MSLSKALWIVATSLVAESAHAESIYLDFSATAGCPTRDEFERQVQARTALVTFVHEPHPGRFFRVRADRAAAAAIGQVTSGRGFEAGTARKVTSPSCEDVVAALALIVALAIDPRAKATPTIDDKSVDMTPSSPATGLGNDTRDALPATAAFPSADEVTGPSPTDSPTDSPTESPTAPTAAAPPAASTTASPPIPARPTLPVFSSAVALTPRVHGSLVPRQPRALTWGVGPSLGAALWLSPPMTPLGSLGLALSAESTQTTLYAPAAQLVIAYARSARVRVAGSGSATFEIWSAEFTYCPLRVELTTRVVVRACGAVQGGQLTGTGYADGVLAHAEPQNRPWGMISELARMQVRLSDESQLDFQAGLGEPLGLYRFVFDTLPQETRIAKVPVLVPRLSLDVTWRFL